MEISTEHFRENNSVSVRRRSIYLISRHVMNNEHRFTFESKQKTKLNKQEARYAWMFNDIEI